MPCDSGRTAGSGDVAVAASGNAIHSNTAASIFELPMVLRTLLLRRWIIVKSSPRSRRPGEGGASRPVPSRPDQNVIVYVSEIMRPRPAQ